MHYGERSVKNRGEMRTLSDIEYKCWKVMAGWRKEAGMKFQKREMQMKKLPA